MRISKAALIISVGLILLVSSLPAGIMLDLSVNGCCGAPSTGPKGVGYVLAGTMFLAGIGLIVFATIKSKKPAAGAKKN